MRQTQLFNTFTEMRFGVPFESSGVAEDFEVLEKQVQHLQKNVEALRPQPYTLSPNFSTPTLQALLSTNSSTLTPHFKTLNVKPEYRNPMRRERETEIERDKESGPFESSCVAEDFEVLEEQIQHLRQRVEPLCL